MKFLKKFLCNFFIALLIIFINYSSSFASSYVTNSSTTISGASYDGFINDNLPQTYSQADLLMEESTGTILYGKNIYKRMYPASTTKVMTAILTLEHCKLTDVATASHNAVYSVPVGYSNANIQEGEQLTIKDLLNVLLIPSANDAAFVLAEHIAGSVDAFSQMMNEKAKEIGCLNTNFVNPNGIHNENHYSTAYDLALIGKYAMQIPEFKQIVSKTSCSLPKTNKYYKEDRLFNTTNYLIKPNYSKSATNYYYQYATGAKTGYTDTAKNCVIATATKDNTSLIVVTLLGKNTEEGLSQRWLDCKNLFEYGFNNFSFQSLATKNSVCQTSSVNGASSNTKNLNLVYSEDVNAYLPNNFDVSQISKTISLTQDLIAPIAKGTVLGNVSYTVGNLTFTTNIVAENDVFKSDIIKTIMEILLIIVVLTIISYILKFNNKHKKKKRKKKSKKSYSLNNFYPKY